MGDCRAGLNRRVRSSYYDYGDAFKHARGPGQCGCVSEVAQEGRCTGWLGQHAGRMPGSLRKMEDRAHPLQSVVLVLSSCSAFTLPGPSVVFMLKHLRLSGCIVPPENIVCAPCDRTRSGGFHPAGAIVLCQNHPGSKRHMEDTLTHELVHMYDHCKFDVDWSNLRHHACSEVGPFPCRWSSLTLHSDSRKQLEWGLQVHA